MSEAFEFTQKSSTILGVILLQNHCTYQSLVSVQISEAFPGLWHHFPWLSPQIKLGPLAKEEVLQILIEYFLTLASAGCVYKKCFLLALLPGVLFSVFRLLLLRATSHANPCNISIPIERTTRCCRILAQEGGVLDGFFPFSPLVSLLISSLMQTAELAQGKTLWQSTRRNVTVRISSKGVLTTTLVLASEFILFFKEMHLNGQSGYADSA